MSQTGQYNDEDGIQTLTGDSGGPVVSDTMGNINILGGTGVVVTGTPGSYTLTIDVETSNFPITPYVVGPIGSAGYQTIQSALNAATADGGGIVYVQPGTYTENLTLYSNTEVVGTPGNSDAGTSGNTTVIVGVHIPPATGSFTFANVRLESATHIFNSAAAGSSGIVLINIFIVVTNGFLFNLPNWVGTLVTYNVGEGSTNNGMVNNSGGATCFFISATHGAGTGQTMVTSGPVIMQEIDFNCPWNAQTGTTIACDYVIFTKTVTCSNNSTGSFNWCRFSTGSSTALTMSSSATINISNSIINTSANPCISGAGAGTLNVNNVSYISNSSLAGTLTAVNNGLTDLGSIRSNFTNHGIILGQGTRGTITALSPSSTAGIPVISQGVSADPVFGTAVVAGGGTGSVTLTNHGVLLGQATSAIVATSVGATGTVLAGNTAADPTFQALTGLAVTSITGTANQIAASASTGAVTLSLVGPYTPATYTSHGVLVGEGTGSIVAVSPSATSGIPVISQGASADPVFGTAVVAGGGTGATSLTAYAVLCGGTTSTAAVQSIASVGTSGFVLTSNGAGALPTFQATAGGGTSVSMQVFTATGTYTPTAGMTYCIVELIGGGGSGGSCANNGGGSTSAGGGGGSGEYARQVFSAATIGVSQAVTIGAGGASINSGGSGNNGANSTFGALMTANKGNGGAAGNSVSSGTSTAAGAGGTGSGATFTVKGGDGSQGYADGVFSNGGAGGDSFFGAGGGGVFLNAAGDAADAYGSAGGGSSGSSGGGGTGSGAGKSGVCIVTEFFQ